jgi:hypothetical protein
MGLGGSPRYGGILLMIMGLGGRSGLSGILCLVFTFGVRIYTAPLLCNFFFTGLCLSCSYIDLFINIFAVKKTKIK